MATDGTSSTLMVGENTEASSRLFVGNLTMNSEASVTGFGGGVVVASGDVNGDDDKPDVLIGHSGDDWTLDFQPQLTTEPTALEDGTTKVYSKPLTFTATVTTPYDDPQLIAIQTRTGDATPETGTYALYQDVFIPTAQVMQMIQQMQQQQQQSQEADFVPSDSDGGLVTEWFPTETIRPTESLDDGGIVIEGSIPTETIHPFVVLI